MVEGFPVDNHRLFCGFFTSVLYFLGIAVILLSFPCLCGRVKWNSEWMSSRAFFVFPLGKILMTHFGKKTDNGNFLPRSLNAEVRFFWQI